MPPVVIAGLIAGAGAIGGAVIAGGAANSAADKQKAAADQAATLQNQATNRAIDLQTRQYDDSKAAAAASLVRAQPWLDVGQSALYKLAAQYGVKVPGQPAASTGASTKPTTGAPGIDRTGAPATPTTPAVTGNAYTGAPDWAAYVHNNPDLAKDEAGDAANRGLSPDDPTELAGYGQNHWTQYGQAEGRVLPGATPAAAQGATDAGADGKTNPPPASPYDTVNNLDPGQKVNFYQGADTSGLVQSPTQQIAALKPGQSVTPYAGLDLSDAAFKASPGYNFRLQQGVGAIDASNSARSLLKSGAALKSLDDYGQGMASQEYGNWYNRQTQGYNDWWNQNTAAANTSHDQLANDYSNWWNRQTTANNNYNAGLSGLAGTGQSALTQANNTTSQLAAQGLTYANNVGNLGTGNATNQSNLLTTTANNQGQAGVGAANAWATGLGSAAGTLSGLANNYFSQPTTLTGSNPYGASIPDYSGITKYQQPNPTFLTSPRLSL